MNDPAPTRLQLGQQRSAATRRRNNLIRKTLKEQFPETDFEFSFRGGFISWRLGPSEHAVKAAIASVTADRVDLLRQEPCDCCGNFTVPSVRSDLIPGLLVCLDCEVFGRWRAMQPPSQAPVEDDGSISAFLRRDAS
jgi:hypothetical protein